MFPIWFNLLLTVASFFGMEWVAWATHKYVMHGWLWSWHKSHHHPYDGVFEKNDLFGIVFSIPAALTMYLGLTYQNLFYLFWIGCGITGYGVFYVLFHDILVHRRLKHNLRPKNSYLRRLIRAHKIHHSHTKKEGAEAFGFLFAPKKYEAK